MATTTQHNEAKGDPNLLRRAIGKADTQLEEALRGAGLVPDEATGA